MKIPTGLCIECDDGKIQPLGNKSLKLCIFHNKKRLQHESQIRQQKRTEAGEAKPERFGFNWRKELRNKLSRSSNTPQSRFKISNRNDSDLRYYANAEPGKGKRNATVQKIADDKWYKTMWAISPHRCEECGILLGDRLSHYFVSHILSKGAHPKLRTHPLNKNVLCPEHHDQWEFGDRAAMKIYKKNQVTIKYLLQWEKTH